MQAALHGMSHQASMIGHQPSMVGHMVSMPARASPGLSMISPGGGPSPSPGPVPQPSEPSMIPEGYVHTARMPGARIARAVQARINRACLQLRRGVGSVVGWHFAFG